jgi:cell division transport system permease protein
VRFRFLLNEVLTGLRRNITMTVAMILTTAISIGLFGGGLLVVRLADNSREIYLDRVETQVFLDDDISATASTCPASPPCKALYDKIRDRKDVKSVRFLNRQDAYNDAIRRAPQWKDFATNEFFPASFIVKLENPEQNTEFAAAMKGLPGVKGLLNEKDLIDRLFAVLDGLSNAAFAVALVQAIGAILLIANMVQVAAYTRRTEIGIMRLVGATRWYTQLPFLVEAMVAATAGVIIAIVGLVVVRALFLENVLSQFYRGPLKIPLIAPVDNLDIIYISPWLFLVGVVMAGVTAYATLRLYVRR